MIPRYTRREMAKIWEPENRFKIWLEIELLALEAWASLGQVPKEAVKAARTKASFNIDRIDTLEKELKHDVIAFLTSVSEVVGPEARFLHKGMTSSDVLDTCLAVQFCQAADILLKDIDQILSILKLRAFEFKDVPCMGRSHGIHGEPLTFGLKLALWYEEMKRNRIRLIAAREDIAVGKISGAMGTFAHFLQTSINSQTRRTTSPIVERLYKLFHSWPNSDWISNSDGLYSSIIRLTQDFRNPAAHINTLTRQDYENCREFVIGANGILWNLISATQPHK